MHFIWNLHKSLYGTDLVLVNDFDVYEKISNTMQKHIANMRCPVPFGSTQIASASINQVIMCNMETYKSYYRDFSYTLLDNLIYNRFNNVFQNNIGCDNHHAIFIIEDDVQMVVYSSLPSLIKNGYNLYINGIADTTSSSHSIINNFFIGYYPLANDSIYDIDELNLENLYII